MDSFIGEIRLFTGLFAPQNWLFCDGRELRREQYQDLYTIIKGIYGGSTETTFFLPDLRGMALIGAGEGKNLTSRKLGDQIGNVIETLNLQQMPMHTHEIKVKNQVKADTMNSNPAGNVWAKASANIYTDTSNTAMDPNAVTSFPGGSRAHNNIQPCIGINYIICYDGIFPKPD